MHATEIELLRVASHLGDVDKALIESAARELSRLRASRSEVIEECAKVADARALWNRNSYSSIYDPNAPDYDDLARVCDDVAADIRKLKEPPHG